MGQRWLDGYSARVEAYLLVDGKRYDIAQIGRSGLIFADTVQIAPGTAATLVLRIDGVEERENVVLCNGSREPEELVPFF